MAESTPQIFQTSSPTRWVRFKWTLRVLLFIFLFFIGVFVVAIYLAGEPPKPVIESKEKAYEAKSNRSSQKNYKGIKGFRDFLSRKEKEESRDSLKRHDSTSFIRAAFYTPWTAASSLPDLKKNGDKLNTIFPEWFFMSANERIQSRIDSEGLAVMRQKGLSILPMISNFNSQRSGFDRSLVKELLSDEGKSASFISSFRDTILAYGFNGINIDFEDLGELSGKPFTNFIAKLSEEFHRNGLRVTVDLETSSSYDYNSLSDYCDHIVLMAYDQYNMPGDPGPVAHQKWIESELDKVAKEIPHSKIILGVAGYGYDWFKNEESQDTVATLTFSDAINRARIANTTIQFDNNSYNLHFGYIEETASGNIQHEVWFADAASLFNELRFSDEYGTAGTALWRLGSEDPRLWHFYNKGLNNDAIDKNEFDFNTLADIPTDPFGKPGYVGSGEIMDIIGVPQPGKIKYEIDRDEKLLAEESYSQLPSGYIIRRSGEDTVKGRGHKIIFTFDDGPDPEWTPQVLDILEKEKIPASFFVVGMQVEKNIPILKRIQRDGFEIGNHTFTHSNLATMSLSRAEVEMKLTRLLIESITGRSTILFRAPYNADSEPQTFEELEPIARSSNENYITIGESIDPMDWQEGVLSDSIIARVIRQVEERNASIILFHDAGGNRSATIEALPTLIKYFRNKGYRFTSLADLMGKTYADVMPAIPHSRSGWVTRFNYFLALTLYWSGYFIFALFIIGIILSIARLIFMLTLASIQKMREKNMPLQTGFEGRVSILVPAYNESVNIIRTVESLLKQDHKNFEVIVIDDGSTDETYQRCKTTFADEDRVKVFTKPNGGKASALNYGIAQSDSEVLVCIDADTQLKKDALSLLTQSITEENIAAVAGNVKVGNEVNMITKWQSIEYITSQNFDRRAFHLLNCITVVPGAIGAFRKSALLEAGGFTSDTLAEDCDLTMRFHKLGYRIVNCNKAISYTEAPETFQQFIKQRFRWSFGVMQCFWKNKDALFAARYKNFGLIAMPNILIYQIILPFLAPLADFVLLVSLIGAAFGIIPISLSHIIFYYFIFTLVDVGASAISFAFERENPRKLIWIIPQKFIYRQIMYYILIRSVRKAIKGELQQWGILKRTGSVGPLRTA